MALKIRRASEKFNMQKRKLGNAKKT